MTTDQRYRHLLEGAQGTLREMGLDREIPPIAATAMIAQEVLTLEEEEAIELLASVGTVALPPIRDWLLVGFGLGLSVARQALNSDALEQAIDFGHE